MRIAIISRGRFPGFDGPARRVKYIGAGLAHNGCDVTLIVAYPPSQQTCDNRFEQTYGYRYHHTICADESASMSLLKKIYYKIYGTWKVHAAIKNCHAQQPLDVLFICGVGFIELLVACWTAKTIRVKIAVDKNDTNYRLKAQYGIDLYGVLSGINIALGDFLILRCADVIFTVNSLMFEKYGSRAGGKVKYIIPSFVDRREVEAAQQRNELFGNYQAGFRLLSVITTSGHIYGFVPFARALSLLYHKYEFRLFVLSTDTERVLAKLDQILIENDIKHITSVLVNIAPEIIPSLYSSADIFLNAQQEPPIAEGGFPGKTAEILAAQKPIVTTLFSDLASYYVDRKNCLVVRYDDIDSYVSALSALFEDGSLRESLGNEAKKTAFEFFEYIDGTRKIEQDLCEILKDNATQGV